MKVTIRKFEEKDIRNKVKWINDKRNNEYLHYDLPLEYEKTLNWFKKNEDRIDRYDAIIEVDGISVGLIGLLSIDDKNSKAEYYITMGEQAYKGKGVAKIASKLLLEYAFKKINLNKVYLFIESNNINAQRFFEKIDFIKEGLLRQDIKTIDGLTDRYIYGICESDYYKKKLSINHINPSSIIKLKNNGYLNNIYIKRDDLIPISFGGNKARKALLFFKDINENKSDCVVTYGSTSSNHCRIIANMASARGIPCYIISPCEASRDTYNSKMIKLLGAKIIESPLSKISITIDENIKELKSQGYNPYFIQGGGHGNIGTQAYIDAYKEILSYEEIKGRKFDYIFHATGTGTTQAGLVCGSIINNDNRKIVGISIARNSTYGGQVVLESVNDYLDIVDENYKFKEKINFIDDYILDGYGTYNIQILETIKDILLNNGIPLDTTYTGKAFWGMKEYIKKNKIKDKTILFIHTGGTPLFFDDLEELINGI